MTLNQLKTRAARYDLMIRKDGHGDYLLVDKYTNCLMASGPMTLEQVEAWLEDLEHIATWFYDPNRLSQQQ